MFPALNPEQIQRAGAHGHVRRVQGGEILVEAGLQNTRFFIVKTGQLEIVRPPGTDERFVAPLGPGQFTGETSMLAGRRGLVRIRVSEAGVVIELERDQLLALVQTDSELVDCPRLRRCGSARFRAFPRFTANQRVSDAQ